MVKCEKCKTREATTLVGNTTNGEWSLSCPYCYEQSEVFLYWIEIPDLRKNIDFWRHHLSRKNWFSQTHFDEAINRATMAQNRRCKR